MPIEPLLALRRSLLLAIGLGACTGATNPAAPRGGTPKGEAGHGYVHESNGTVHRASAETCDPSYAPPACTEPSGVNACTRDADCTAGAYARCVQDHGQVGAFCRCDYACRTDADCSEGQVCVCGDALGDGRHATCVAAKCRTDAECGDGVCGLSRFHNGCVEQLVLACRTAADACTGDGDCADGQRCAHDGASGTWACLGVTCAIGRPLVIDGATRTAPAVARTDWLTELDGPRDLPPAMRAALADHWSGVAALEHASVASFAALTLDLMALGAPPDLLAEAQRSALDEIEHARVAWSLASLWAERPLGPGPLSLAGLPLRHGLSDIVRELVRDGCVGETLGAAEAQLCADLADHPSLAVALETIARDEARHAAFAWRTLRWLLAAHGPEVRVVALTAVAEARAELAAATVAADPDELSLPTLGLLGPSLVLEHRREAFAAVIDPVLQAMFGPTAQA